MLSTRHNFLLPLVIFSGVAIVNIKPLDAQSIIAAPDGTRTIVTPNGSRLDIDGGTLSGNGTNLFHSFQEFNLNSNETANFLSHPQIHNILSRVVGGNASIINGLIQVTGGNSNLFLMNPAGIVFGQNASLNVPVSFTATTANGIGFTEGWFNATGVSNYQALIGNPNHFAFTMTQPGSIVNAGNLAVGEGHNLTLLGGNVFNTGSLSASGGNITLAAIPGKNVVRLSQEGMVLSLEIEPILTMTDSQLPTAIKISPTDLPGLITGGNLTDATEIRVNPNGSVSLTGSSISIPTQGGVAIASGSLNVFGQSGGAINVLGDKVEISHAIINASGINAAGTVLIGGDYKGQGRVPNAGNTYVSKNSVINADALEGNGGKVIIWADETTVFYGNATARGNYESGKGGFIEVSGKENLVYDGLVDLRAANGNWGTLLLDPASLIISDSAIPDNYNLENPTTIPSSQQLSTSRLISALNNANVNLQATNEITVNSAVNASTNTAGTNAGNLTLTTPNVTLNAPILLQAGKTLSGTATIVNIANIGIIQNAVDVSVTGTNINIAPGIFSESSTININKSLSLIGAGQNNTIINGINASRLFNITAGDVTFDSLTIKNGNAGNGDGGGINHTGTGTLNVINSTISNNTASQGGGISNSSGTLNVTNSNISDNTATQNGGGIQNNATATINNSTLIGNQLDVDGLTGGGIFNYEGTLTLNNSTVSRNIAGRQGGGGITSDFGLVTINNSTLSDNSAANTTFGGGGILSFQDTNLTINNSTISNNSITTNGGGIFVESTPVNLNNVTIAGNTATAAGGGIFQLNGTINIRNTIIAGNNNPTSPDVSGIFRDSGNNLIGVSDGSSGFRISTLVGTIANPIDPLLGLLQNNGGSTPTQALLPGSPALNAGVNVAGTTTDQRGVSRIGTRDILPDIGAYEAIRVLFSSPTYSADNTSSATVNVEVDRTPATGTGGNVSVNYSTRNNTAIANTDYTTTTGTLTFTNASPSQTFNIPILTTATSNRTVNLNLNLPRNAVFGSLNAATLTIFNPPTPTPIATPTPTPAPAPPATAIATLAPPQTPPQFSLACPLGLTPLEVREDLARESGRKLVVRSNENNCQFSRQQTIDVELPTIRIKD